MWGRGRQCLDVPGTKRKVKIEEQTGEEGADSQWHINSNRPADIKTANSCSFLKGKAVSYLVLDTNCHGGDYGEIHSPKEDEWKDLFSYITQHATCLSKYSHLVVKQSNTPNTTNDNLLQALPGVLYGLIERGVNRLSIVKNQASASVLLTVIQQLEHSWHLTSGIRGTQLRRKNKKHDGIELGLWEMEITGIQNKINDVKTETEKINLCSDPIWITKQVIMKKEISKSKCSDTGHLNVRDSDRKTKVEIQKKDNHYKMTIRSNRPSDVIDSKALDQVKDQKLSELSLYTDHHGGCFGQPHSPTEKEWKDLLKYIINKNPFLSFFGQIEIGHGEPPATAYDPLLKVLPVVLSDLIESGIRVITISTGHVQAAEIQAMMTAIENAGWVMQKRQPGTYIQRKSSAYEGILIHLIDITITGTNSSLDKLRTMNEAKGILSSPTWNGIDDPHERWSSPRDQDTFHKLYQEACKSGSVSTCRARLVVLGHEGVGKTSLIRSLLQMPFEEKHEETNLIEIHGTQVEEGDESVQWRKIEGMNRDTKEALDMVVSSMRKKEIKVSVKSGEKDPCPSPVASNVRPLWDINKANLGEAMEEQKAGVSKVEEAPPVLNEVKRFYHQKESSNLSVTIWDFAGQRLFYAVHQLFLTVQAMYLVVLDASLGLDEVIPTFRNNQHGQRVKDTFNPRTQREYLKYFMRTINARLEVGRANIWPATKILIVCTKCDLITPEMAEEFIIAVNENLEKLRKYTIITRHVGGVFRYSSKTPNDWVDGLKHLIKQNINAEPFTVQIPVKWVLFRNLVKKLKYRTWKEVYSLAVEAGLKDEDEVKAAIKYFHDLGEVLYFDTPSLKNFIVCDPLWVIQQVGKILTIPKYQDLDRRLDESRWNWADLNNHAILHQDIIDNCWEEARFQLCDLLQMFFIIHPLPCTEEGQTKSKVRFLVPSFLKRCEGVEYEDGLRGPPPVYLQIQEGFLPIGFASAVFTGLAQNNRDKFKLDENSIHSDSALFLLLESSPSVSMQIREYQIQSDSDGDQYMLKMTAIVGKDYSRMKKEEQQRVRHVLVNALKQVQTTVNNCLKTMHIPLRQKLFIRCKCSHSDLIEICKQGTLEDEVICKSREVEDFKTNEYHPWFYEHLHGSMSQEYGTDREDELLRRLTTCRAELLGHIDITPCLIARLQRILTQSDRSDLRNEYIGSQWRVERLLQIVEREGMEACNILITALTEEKQHRAVRMLLGESESGVPHTGLDPRDISPAPSTSSTQNGSTMMGNLETVKDEGANRRRRHENTPSDDEEEESKSKAQKVKGVRGRGRGRGRGQGRGRGRGQGRGQGRGRSRGRGRGRGSSR